jgi:hypothetical protein
LILTHTVLRNHVPSVTMRVVLMLEDDGWTVFVNKQREYRGNGER